MANGESVQILVAGRKCGLYLPVLDVNQVAFAHGCRRRVSHQESRVNQ